VAANHPKDLDVMYTDGCCNVRLSDESVHLWGRRTREYVEEVAR
jgi:hypothetical protein